MKKSVAPSILRQETATMRLPMATHLPSIGIWSAYRLLNMVVGKFILTMFSFVKMEDLF